MLPVFPKFWATFKSAYDQFFGRIISSLLLLSCVEGQIAHHLANKKTFTRTTCYQQPSHPNWPKSHTVVFCQSEVTRNCLVCFHVHLYEKLDWFCVVIFHSRAFITMDAQSTRHSLFLVFLPEGVRFSMIHCRFQCDNFLVMVINWRYKKKLSSRNLWPSNAWLNAEQ